MPGSPGMGGMPQMGAMGGPDSQMLNPDAYSAPPVPGPSMGPETAPEGLMGRLYQDQLAPQGAPLGQPGMGQPGMGGPQGQQRPRPYLSTPASPMPTTRNQYPRS